MGQRDEKDKMKIRKEKLAGYFYDLSKLIFTAMVLGGMSSAIYWRLQALYRIRCFCRNYINIYYCILCKQNFKVLIIWKD